MPQQQNQTKLKPIQPTKAGAGLYGGSLLAGHQIGKPIKSFGKGFGGDPKIASGDKPAKGKPKLASGGSKPAKGKVTSKQLPKKFTDMKIEKPKSAIKSNKMKKPTYTQVQKSVAKSMGY